MKKRSIILAVLLGVLFISEGAGATKNTSGKIRLLVVSSYHQGYEWSMETNRGFCAALLKFRYFDKREQVTDFTNDDAVETSGMILKKLWMDTKGRNSKAEMEAAAKEIYLAAREFKPTLIFLGDDEAAQYVGPAFLDTSIPVVFWGLNNTPIKYGLVDSMDSPGHNVTGVYQTGKYAECIRLLKRLAPKAKTFAVLSVDSVGPRSHYKAIEYLARTGALPMKLVETVATVDYETWQKKALELQKKVDAFFVINYAGLEDKAGNHVPVEEVAAWYRENIKVPETALLRQSVKLGMLCGVEDPGYAQGFDAVVIANDILARGANPAGYRPRTPQRGIRLVNRERAKTLGIGLPRNAGIDEVLDGPFNSGEKPHGNGKR